MLIDSRYEASEVMTEGLEHKYIGHNNENEASSHQPPVELDNTQRDSTRLNLIENLIESHHNEEEAGGGTGGSRGNLSHEMRLSRGSDPIQFQQITKVLQNRLTNTVDKADEQINTTSVVSGSGRLMNYSIDLPSKIHTNSRALVSESRDDELAAEINKIKTKQRNSDAA